ncbi:INO80 complex subunit 2 [Hyphodiscus hymeniophilus]|uniref:INO80 complex subunit 2 n=1 Tax=Hyphodiscus hymeniophilus TaxID=353542 RepID=A0A9P6VDK9_9HELO|nr:INO80 complex subunit 2 [Hyphodiscus hymeniophilus]
MSSRRSQRSAAIKATEAIADVDEPRTSRSRRTASDNTSSATVSRGPAPATSRSPQSMRLTVKTSSSKLREATRASSAAQSISVNSRDPFIGGEILEGKRPRNVRKSYVLDSDSEEEEDAEMEDVGDDDVEGESAEEEDDEDIDAEEDGLGDEDAEGDIDMDIPPPPPVIKISRAQSGKQTITAKPPTKVDHKTVEQKEVQLGSDDDDEELSELDSDLGEEVEEEEGMQTGNEEDAEGEEEEIEVEAEDDDEELDSDDETPMDGSRATTPDLNKLTKRQRARLEEGGSGHLLALPDEVQVKKHFTPEEHAMRRAEMARRRKNLSEKRNEEEKMETINKLLKKQAPKTNARRRDLNNIGGEATPDTEGHKPHPLFVRWVSNKDGNRIGVPEEWMESPISGIFQGGVKQGASSMGGKLIEEVS